MSKQFVNFKFQIENCKLFPLFLCTLLLVVTAVPVRTTTLDELQAQKKALELRAQADRDAAAKQKSVAELAAEKIQALDAQIGSLQGSIQDTSGQIIDTGSQIDQKNQDIANLESDLRKLDNKKSALVRQLYEASVSRPDTLIWFSNTDVSRRQQEEQSFAMLEKSVATLYSKTNSLRLAVQQSRDDLTKKKNDLLGYQDQLQQQQSGLANYQNQQAALKDNAEQAMADFQAKALATDRQAAGVEQKIEAMIQAQISAAGQGTFTGTGGRTGTHVTQGQIIAHEGSTGYSTGPHVHFEVDYDGRPVEPTQYVNSGLMIYPLTNFYITQGFGYTIYAQQGFYGPGGIHTGVDLAGPYGEPVMAPASGTIIIDQYYGGYGNAVAIRLDTNPHLVALMGHLTGH